VRSCFGLGLFFLGFVVVLRGGVLVGGGGGGGGVHVFLCRCKTKSKLCEI